MRLRLLSPRPVALALALGLGALASQSHETTTTASPEVCKSKTINYITHTLPQQCLRTNWSSANSTDHNTTTTTTTATATATAIVSGDKVVETAASSTTSGSGQAEPSSKQNETEAQKDGGSGDGKGTKETEDDSEDLATSSFMSFEEWKAMMLQKSGQDPADLKGRKHHDGREGTEPGSNHGLDSWGDDGEIALDFDVLSGKIAEMTATKTAKGATASADVPFPEVPDPASHDDGVAHYRRPKDAGKTCKERFSYSSFDGGATVLKTSPGTKNAKAILVENKDSYMLFTCSHENKFVIVELSEDILVDTVVLANFEFFSSMIRSFRISVSDKYPVKIEKWKDIGTFQARNSRDIQSFLVENPKIWAKYMRIEFLSHYGNEYYCPVSLLRVHGTRMLDSWKDAEAGADDDEPAETITGPEAVPEQELPQENTTSPVPEPTDIAKRKEAHNVSLDKISYGISPWYAPLYGAPEFETCSIGTPTTTGTVQVSPPVHAANDSNPPAEPIPNTRGFKGAAVTTSPTVASTVVPVPPADISSPTDTSANNSVTSTSTSTSESPVSSADSTSNKAQSASPSAKSSVTTPKPPPGAKIDPNTPKPPVKQSANGNQNKTSTSTSSSAAASPTVQESFFKSMSKRLQFLESNTTLSLQYIEEQSKFLHQALQKMERRQISRVDTFLDNLNNTVLGELRSVRQQYDQIWQSTVLALETQREHSDREIIALSSRLNLLADEVVFQKRMAIFQSVLLLCCLVLVLFSRGVLGGGGSGGAAEQWPMAVSSTSQFFNTYLGSPRWPPGSPRSASRENTPTQYRRASASVVAGKPVRPNGAQRSVSGPGLAVRARLAPLTHSASYADKVLPLTPRSEGFGGGESGDSGSDRGSDTEDNGSPTPPPTVRQAPMIRVDQPEVRVITDDLLYEDGGSAPEGQQVEYDFKSSSDALTNGFGVDLDNSAQKSRLAVGDDGANNHHRNNDRLPSSSEGEDSSGSTATSFLHGRESSPDDEEEDGDDDDDEEETDDAYDREPTTASIATTAASAETAETAKPGAGPGSGTDPDHVQPSRPPPLTRSPLSELGGNIRKPLPALPEDPT